MATPQRSFKERSRPLRALSDESRSKPYPSAARKLRTYCICNGPSEGLMIECDSCKDWFHAKCVNIEESKIPKHFYCAPCAGETQESKDLEETIVEALSLLAEQAAFERVHVPTRPDLSDRDEESMEEGMPALTSDDKENVANGAYRHEVEPIMKKRLSIHHGRSAFDPDHLRFPSPFSPQYPSSPLSDHSGSEDSCPSVESPSSPSDSPAPTRRHSSHPTTKTYTRKNKKQISVLEKYYEDNPSPDPNMIHFIALESGLPDQKVSRWFYDKRRRSKQLGHTF